MNRRGLMKHLATLGLFGPAFVRSDFATVLRPAAAGQTHQWPNAANTGVRAGTNLTRHDGNMTVNTDGAVIRELDIRGTLTIKTRGVTIENCRITTGNSWDWYAVLTAGDTIIQDCTINGGNVNAGQNGINGSGKFFRNNIFNTENGIAPGSNTLIQDNYIHDFMAPGAPHYDGIQIDGGQSNVSIRHNTIVNQWPQTSAVMINNWAGPISNIEIDENLLIGGGYTVYVDGHFNNNPISGVSITNNHLGGGRWGNTSFNKTSPIYTGNANDGVAMFRALDMQR